MSTNYNTLIVGAGRIGSKRAHVIKKLSKKAGLFIYDVNINKAKNLAREVNGTALRSLNEGLKNKNINIIVIATVNKYAKNICISALKNGKHVLCEKPMGKNYKEAKEIANAVKKYKKVFKCGFNHRYHPAIQKAYKLCKEKRVGKILYIRGVYGHGGRKGYDKEWRSKLLLSGGGQLLDQGSHLIDLSHWFFNFEPIKKVCCVAKTLFWKIEVDDNAFVILETKSGKVAHLHASWTQWKNKFLFEIFGSKGNIVIEGLGRSYGTETLRLFQKIKTGFPPKITTWKFKGQDKSWEEEWKDFTKAILKGKKAMSNEDESILIMKTINSLYKKG